MQLSKEQIQYIENRLIKEGVKHWDIRIEMLDHIVTDVESRLERGKRFNESVQNSFVALGWKENFNGSNMEEPYKEAINIVYKKYNKNLSKEIEQFFKSPKGLLIVIIFTVIYIKFSDLMSHNNYVRFSYILFAIPMVIYFYELINVWTKKIGKSIHKEAGLNLLAFSFIVFNTIMLMMKSEGDYFSISLAYQKPILFVLLPIHFVLSIVTYKVYKKSIHKVEKLKNLLLQCN